MNRPIIQRHEGHVTMALRARRHRQEPAVLWFTGRPAAGKSTIADLVERRLFEMGRSTYRLDGDDLRHGLCRDLGFGEADRSENIRRAAETARLFVDAGLLVMAAFVSPFQADRAKARDLVGSDRFIEIFVDTSLEIAEKRDPKGLYKRARSGEIAHFTGVSSPYEPPVAPDLRLAAGTLPPDVLAQDVVDHLRRRRLID